MQIKPRIRRYERKYQFCIECDKPLPLGRRKYYKYCSFNCREKGRLRTHRDYNKRCSPTLQQKFVKKWYEENKHKRKIEDYTRNTLKIPLASNCEFCNSKENLERHHPDYDFPEIIVTTCRHCHKWVEK